VNEQSPSMSEPLRAASRLRLLIKAIDAALAAEPTVPEPLREAARQLADTVRDLRIRSPYLEARMNDVYAALATPQASPEPTCPNKAFGRVCGGMLGAQAKGAAQAPSDGRSDDCS